MNKWGFSVPCDRLDSLPEIFRDALTKRVSLEGVRLNTNDDDGWSLTASHQGASFRILCRNHLAGDNAENVLWCEGVKKSVISLFDKKLPPPPVLVTAIAEVLSNDIGPNSIETLTE
jgi:hypothetical protein